MLTPINEISKRHVFFFCRLVQQAPCHLFYTLCGCKGTWRIFLEDAKYIDYHTPWCEDQEKKIVYMFGLSICAKLLKMFNNQSYILVINRHFNSQWNIKNKAASYTKKDFLFFVESSESHRSSGELIFLSNWGFRFGAYYTRNKLIQPLPFLFFPHCI